MKVFPALDLHNLTGYTYYQLALDLDMNVTGWWIMLETIKEMILDFQESELYTAVPRLLEAIEVTGKALYLSVFDAA